MLQRSLDPKTGKLEGDEERRFLLILPLLSNILLMIFIFWFLTLLSLLIVQEGRSGGQVDGGDERQHVFFHMKGTFGRVVVGVEKRQERATMSRQRCGGRESPFV